jgi:hypothetical protein
MLEHAQQEICPELAEVIENFCLGDETGTHVVDRDHPGLKNAPSLRPQGDEKPPIITIGDYRYRVSRNAGDSVFQIREVWNKEKGYHEPFDHAKHGKIPELT